MACFFVSIVLYQCFWFLVFFKVCLIIFYCCYDYSLVLVSESEYAVGSSMIVGI